MTPKIARSAVQAARVGHRRRPGGHAGTVSLPLLLALAVALALTGCSGGSGGAVDTSPPPIRTAPTSEPSTPPATPSSAAADGPATSPTPVASPTAPITATRRKVTRPAGARDPDVATCIAVADLLLDVIRDKIWLATTRDEQVAGLVEVGELAAHNGQQLRKARNTWRADGYPAGFPVVHDLDRLIDLYGQVYKAGQTGDVEAVPGLYTRIEIARKQINADLNSAKLCQAS
jgi:hypothetical protein